MKKNFVILNLIVLFIAFTLYAKKLEIVKPNGGETWTLNSSKTIVLKNIVSKYKLRLILLRNNVNKGIIKRNVPKNATSFQWIVGKTELGTVPDGPDYKIKVREESPDDDKLFDVSDRPFTIKKSYKYLIKLKEKSLEMQINKTAPKNKFHINESKNQLQKKKPALSKVNQPRANFTVNHYINITCPPTKGINWETGSQVRIKWDTSITDYLSVELYNYSGKKQILYLGNSNTKYFNWVIPSGVYKWPGNYTIRVATLDNKMDSISKMFHIGKRLLTSTFTLNALTTNKLKMRRKKPRGKDGWQPPVPTPDPGPGKIRVGFDRTYSDKVKRSYIYRSHVFFNVAPYKTKGLLLKATLKYRRFSGLGLERLFKLNTKWNGAAHSLFTVGCDHLPNKSNLTAIVSQWFNDPDSNYGLVFIGTDESLGFDVHKGGAASFDNLVLVLDFAKTE